MSRSVQSFSFHEVFRGKDWIFSSGSVLKTTVVTSFALLFSLRSVSRRSSFVYITTNKSRLWIIRKLNFSNHRLLFPALISIGFLSLSFFAAQSISDITLFHSLSIEGAISVTFAWQTPSKRRTRRATFCRDSHQKKEAFIPWIIYRFLRRQLTFLQYWNVKFSGFRRVDVRPGYGQKTKWRWGKSSRILIRCLHFLRNFRIILGVFVFFFIFTILFDPSCSAFWSVFGKKSLHFSNSKLLRFVVFIRMADWLTCLVGFSWSKSINQLTAKSNSSSFDSSLRWLIDCLVCFFPFSKLRHVHCSGMGPTKAYAPGSQVTHTFTRTENTVRMLDERNSNRDSPLRDRSDAGSPPISRPKSPGSNRKVQPVAQSPRQAGGATAELDDLMASLNDIKVVIDRLIWSIDCLIGWLSAAIA